MIETVEPAILNVARALGPRGSRSAVGDADPAAELTPAAAAVLAAIPAWWSARALSVGLVGDWLDVCWAVDAEPPLTLGGHAPLEAELGVLSPDEIGAAYVSSLDGGTRARHARHYTPAALASQLWAMTKRALGLKQPLEQLPGLVRDPACGSAALLLPIVREHLAASYGDDPQMVLNGLPMLVEGVDTDPAAVWIANVVLAAEMLPTLARVPEGRRRRLPALARVGDGLDAGVRQARALIMNPPYGRVRLNEADRKRFAATLYGHANLYGLFMASGLESLDESGVMSALVPTSFTAGKYFAPLREVLGSMSRLYEICFVADRSGVFGSVLQETCLATFSRRRVRKTTVRSISSETTYVASVATPSGSSPWILPRRSDLATVAAGAARLPLTLGTAGWRVSTGPLVWNRRKDDLHRRGAAGRHLVIWAADVDRGQFRLDSARSAMRYVSLRSERDRRLMLLREPAVLVQRTTAPEQVRRLVAVELTNEHLAEYGGGVVVENHVNVLRASRTEPDLSRGLLARLLATDTFDRLARCVSGSVALSAYELESMPLPDRVTLASWESLTMNELAVAVARAYRNVAGLQ